MTIDAKRAFLTAMERTHGPGLRRFLARRSGGRRAEVPDLVQEVFLRLLRVDDHETIRNPQAYLYTIANHVLHQHALRDAAAGALARVADVLVEVQSAEETNPERLLETEQRFEAIGRALEARSSRAYTTLLLHRCDGIPLKEIAPRIGCSYTMVKRYLAQALSFCQRMLDEMESCE